MNLNAYINLSFNSYLARRTPHISTRNTMAPGTVIITGARGGMTALTAKSYHQRHPEDHLILLVRDPAKVLPAELPAPSDKVHHAAFEMSDLSAVRSAAKNIVEMVTSGKVPPIEALVCSAAIQVVGPDQPRLTKDGYEETCAVNHLAHFALILDLLPVMKSDGRIVIVGSDSHKPDYKYFKLKAKYDKLEKLLKVQPGSEPVAEAQDRGMQRYGTSKLLQIMTANEVGHVPLGSWRESTGLREFDREREQEREWRLRARKTILTPYSSPGDSAPTPNTVTSEYPYSTQAVWAERASSEIGPPSREQWSTTPFAFLV